MGKNNISEDLIAQAVFWTASGKAFLDIEFSEINIPGDWGRESKMIEIVVYDAGPGWEGVVGVPNEK